MNCKILNEPPESGKYKEISYNVNPYDNFWVLFQDEEYNEWVGCFGVDGLGGKKVYQFIGTTKYFVIANSVYYTIDVNTCELIYSYTSHDPILNTIQVDNDDIIFAYGHGTIYAFSSSEFLDKFADAASIIDLEKIEIDYCSDEIVKGRVYENLELIYIYEFIFDLKVKKFASVKLISKYNYQDSININNSKMRKQSSVIDFLKRMFIKILNLYV